MKKYNRVLFKILLKLKCNISRFKEFSYINNNSFEWEKENFNERESVKNKTKSELVLEVLEPKKKLKIMEIGTAGGNTTEEFLNKVMLNRNSIMYAFDPYTPYPDKNLRNNDLVLEKFLARFKNDITENRLKFSRTNSFDGLINLINQNHKETFDLIFIDGNHKAKNVLEDFLLSLTLVKKNGYIMFDDYKWFPTMKKNRLDGYKSFKDVPLEKVPKYAIELISKFKDDIRYVSAANNYNVLLFQKK